jgi:hypothetical protein
MRYIGLVTLLINHGADFGACLCYTGSNNDDDKHKDAAASYVESNVMSRPSPLHMFHRYSDQLANGEPCYAFALAPWKRKIGIDGITVVINEMNTAISDYLSHVRTVLLLQRPISSAAIVTAAAAGDTNTDNPDAGPAASDDNDGNGCVYIIDDVITLINDYLVLLPLNETVVMDGIGALFD